MSDTPRTGLARSTKATPADYLARMRAEGKSRTVNSHTGS